MGGDIRFHRGRVAPFHSPGFRSAYTHYLSLQSQSAYTQGFDEVSYRGERTRFDVYKITNLS